MRTSQPWTRREKIGIAIVLLLLIAFGANLENRTALRRVPMTDLGVFSCAAEAIKQGTNVYSITDWHGWHYQYPPLMAILFRPLAHPLPPGPAQLDPGVAKTALNTPWGYNIDSHKNHFGLHRENFRFFIIVGVWYWISVFLVFFSTHSLACALEGSALRQSRPADVQLRRRWWALRLFPILLCLGSVGTELSRGQVDLMMLAAICLGIYLTSRRSETAAGLSFSFPVMVKLFPPFLILYPLWRRRWKMSIGILAGLVCGLWLIPLVTFGPSKTSEIYGNWVEVLAKPALGKGTDQSRAKELTGLNSTDNQSLLAFFHNWAHHSEPRKDRPQTASSIMRVSVYIVSGFLLLAVIAASGFRPKDSPSRFVLTIGSLVALSLVASPIVHNFYYLLIIPILTAIIYQALGSKSGLSLLRLPPAILFFTAIDFLARVPGIGSQLRDWGFPLLSVLGLLAAALTYLLNSRNAAGDPQTSPTVETDSAIRLENQIQPGR